MRKQDIGPGDRVLVQAIVESPGHDDHHIIVRVGNVPVQVAIGAVLKSKK